MKWSNLNGQTLVPTNRSPRWSNKSWINYRCDEGTMTAVVSTREGGSLVRNHRTRGNKSFKDISRPYIKVRGLRCIKTFVTKKWKQEPINPSEELLQSGTSPIHSMAGPTSTTKRSHTSPWTPTSNQIQKSPIPLMLANLSQDELQQISQRIRKEVNHSQLVARQCGKLIRIVLVHGIDARAQNARTRGYSATK